MSKYRRGSLLRLVAEQVCRRAAQQTGLNARILRLGQIVGDSVHGQWNAAEAVPLTVRSAWTIGCLPIIDEVFIRLSNHTGCLMTHLGTCLANR